MAYEVASSKRNTQRQQRRRKSEISTAIGALTAVLVACLVFGASGCVLGGGDDSPVLSVDLLWDRNPSLDRFSKGDCASAGVTWNDWKLEDEHKEVVAESEDDGEQCWDTIPFVDLKPGMYRLLVTGYDENNEVVWKSTCTGLDLQRFDSLYECKIDQVGP